MWFWMGYCLWWAEENILWDFWLCSTWNTCWSVIWLYCWSMVSRCSYLWVVGWKSTFLSHQQKIDDEENFECKFILNVGWKDCDRVPWRNVKRSNVIHWKFNKEKPEIEDKQLADSGASIYKVCSYKTKVWLKEKYMIITFGYGMIYLESI